MDCKDIDKLLTACLEGVASPEEEKQVKAHLDACSKCREELEIRQISRNRLGQALKLAASRVTPPEASDTINEIMANTIKTPAHRWLQPALAVITVMVAAIALVLVPLWSADSPSGVMGPMMPPPLSEYIKGYTYTLALLAGVLMMAGLAFHSRFAQKIAGFMSIVFGGIGVYLGLEAILSATKSDQTLIMGVIPIFGIIAGTVYIKRQTRRRWLADAGLVLCLLALVLYITFLVGYRHWFSWILLAAAIAIPAGIIGYSFHSEIAGFFHRRRSIKSAASRIAPLTGSWESIARQAGIKSRDEKPVSMKSGMNWLAVPLSIFLLIILVGGFLPMMGGMAPPPPPAPAMVSDDSGGAFLVWLEKPWLPDAAIRAQYVDAQGNLLWGEKGQQIAYSKVAMPYAVSDGESGVVIAWGDSDSRNITRLGSDGDTIWTLEDFTSWSVQGMVEDGSGGAILLLYDRIDSIYAQRVSAEGLLLWGETGTFLGNTQEVNRGKSLVSDGLGGAVITWQEQSGMDMEIRAQRLNAEGVALWGDSGIVITSREGNQGNNRDIISDGMGSFIVAWDTGGLTSDTDVYIQKLDGDGNFLWGAEGIMVCEDQPGETFGLGNMQSHPQMAADGTGGVIVTWHDRRRIMNREIFAQRISAAGDILWDENGVWLWNIPADYIGTTSGILDAVTMADGTGGVIVVWTGHNVSYTKNSVIYAQRLSVDGQRLWSEEKVYSNPSFRSQGYASIVSDGQGGIIIGSRVGESSSISQTDSVYAQKIDSKGSRIWGEGGLEIQKVRSALTVLFVAAGAILAAILVLIGVFRRNRIARIFTSIIPVLLGIAGLFGILLVIGPFGYSYSWAYIPDTTANLLSAAVIPVTGLAIGVVGIWKRTAPKWVMIPIVVFGALVTVIVELIILAA